MRSSILALLLATSLLLTGCATTSSPNQVETQSTEVVDKNTNIDPFEKMNRAVYGFNVALDNAILKPVAKGYKKVLPRPVRAGVANFFSNLLEPATTVNDLLQGKPKQAAKSLGRFLVNSTVGILGIFDVATSMNLPKHKEDFGQTFAVWGIESGPYIMLPFLGPSNVRDFGGTIARYALADVTTVLDLDANLATGLTTLRLIDQRAGLLGFDETFDLQVDPYAFIRESYAQARLKAIHDGVLPETEEDEFEEDLFDD
ncbi:MAG: phospholipid-binding lipoprotein MlaA [Saprospiraceae bacterium]|jgi:phospholipid-binding lipoprotein MlaA